MEQKILVLNYTEKTFTNKDTGEKSEMLLIQYGVYIDDDSQKTKGWHTLDCYCKSHNLELVEKYIGKIVPANIIMIPNSNGMKFKLKSLNNENLI